MRSSTMRKQIRFESHHLLRHNERFVELAVRKFRGAFKTPADRQAAWAAEQPASAPVLRMDRTDS